MSSPGLKQHGKPPTAVSIGVNVSLLQVLTNSYQFYIILVVTTEVLVDIVARKALVRKWEEGTYGSCSSSPRRKAALDSYGGQYAARPRPVVCLPTTDYDWANPFFEIG